MISPLCLFKALTVSHASMSGSKVSWRRSGLSRSRSATGRGESASSETRTGLSKAPGSVSCVRNHGVGNAGFIVSTCQTSSNFPNSFWVDIRSSDYISVIPTSFAKTWILPQVRSNYIDIYTVYRITNFKPLQGANAWHDKRYQIYKRSTCPSTHQSICPLNYHTARPTHHSCDQREVMIQQFIQIWLMISPSKPPFIVNLPIFLVDNSSNPDLSIYTCMNHMKHRCDMTAASPTWLSGGSGRGTVAWRDCCDCIQIPQTIFWGQRPLRVPVSLLYVWE